MVPAGDLREVRSGSKRANIIVVTKCRPDLSLTEKEALLKEIDPLPHQQVFFTEIIYTQPYHLFKKQPANISHDNDVLLLCGIANPNPLKDFLTTHVHTYDMLRYADHHIFTIDDLKEIQKYFEKISSPIKIILTTAQDAIRLEKF